MKKHFLFLLSSLCCTVAWGQTDILDARTNYDIDDEVTVTGIVTNGASLGSVRYIQDMSAGIAIYPGSSWSGWTEPQIGDEISVTGILSEFSGLLEVGPSLSDVTIISSGNPLPDFQLITPDQAGEDLEGELVTVENCQFQVGGGCDGSSGAVTIQGNTTYGYVSNGESGVIYVRSGSPLVGTTLPTGMINLYGIMSQFSFSGVDGYQILPRDGDDLESFSSINLASGVSQSNMTNNSFDVSWTTDVAGSGQVEYGLTPALGQVVEDPEVSTDHTVSLEGLDPGSVYWVKVSSFLDMDVAESAPKPFVTKSNSSGDIRVYFNQAIDNSVATIEEAMSLGADLNDTIAEYILSAEHTLDMAIYNINNSLIVNAINEANANGVEIRYIAQGTNANLGIGDFDAGIAVHYREDDEGSGMHNKFVIIDADYEDKAKVLTGSTNFTTENLVDDYNNVIVFFDQSMAKGYRLEFEEMWGGSGPMPDEENSKFGAAKSINTPTNYIVGDTPVEVYFSPTDHPTAAIECAILETQADCDFCLLALTRDELAEAIISVDNLFVHPRGVIEQTSSQGSDYELLLDNDIDVWSHEGISGQVHHKYCTIDHSNESSDPTLITGSHNWSSSAENVNDENTVIVHDARVANLYFQEFYATYSSLVSVEDQAPVQMSVFPNPTDMYLNVQMQNVSEPHVYSIVDITGRKVLDGTLRTGSLNIVDLRELNHGSYVITIPGLEFSKQFIKR